MAATFDPEAVLAGKNPNRVIPQYRARVRRTRRDLWISAALLAGQTTIFVADLMWDFLPWVLATINVVMALWSAVNYFPGRLPAYRREQGELAALEKAVAED